VPAVEDPALDRWLPPRGRHRLPPELIARSQRERLFEAAIGVVARKGYRAATVADFTKAASVSRTTFYEMFDDKEDCFLTAYDSAVEALLRRVAAAFDAEEEWPERVRAGLAEFLAALAEEPDLARLALLDVDAAGPAAQRRSRTALQRLAPLLDEGRDFAPGGRSLPANTSRMTIGAIVGLTSDEIAAGRTARLLELLPELLFAALVPYVGPADAAERAGRVHRSAAA